MSVQPTVAAQLMVRFDAAIAWDGVTIPSNFTAFTDDGFFDSPVGVIGVGSDWIELDFNAATAVGAPWQVIGPLDGITPAVSYPQAGVVT